ncbi:Ger(x)C family spore germination protein [Tissierella sp. MSJ-40]|uniref:Ger(X)C family spore germination protein n=1 Tax=Tissierella simiarum TaxID=2841534 RepID=A0ABS6ED29_9FIRM|nr:Ger(x)C family spore germination protein [Tissierella simiarum]MBU5440139.1 Ger(x)C family spore germination protein [Tissierella simiarum]
MNKSFILLFVIIITSTFLLTGCWNYNEVEKLAIVSGVAIDKNEKDNKFELTAEVIDLKSTQVGGRFNSQRIQSDGDTILDAIRNMIKISAKKLYWSHATTFILSENVAKEGILPVLDFIARDKEPRLSINIFVSKEKTAAELLSQQSISTEIRSFEMDYMLLANDSLSKVPEVQVYEFMNDLSNQGISPVLPTLEITLNEGKRTAELGGTAVFKKDKLAGFLTLEDTKFLLFVKDKIKGGLLIVNDKEGESPHVVTLEIFKNKTKIIPNYSNGQLSIDIRTRTDVSIAEEDTTKNYIDEKGRAELRKKAEKYLERNIERVIKQAQQEFDSDIFGFGNTIMRKRPDLWKEIGKQWGSIFPELKINVDADIHIKSSGHILKPIQVGD